jgi:protein-S-isoprenylcysteine O-methyltransferase Ste14
MNDTTKSWLFVVVQAFLLVLLIFLTDSRANPSSTLQVIGNVIKFVGVVLLLISFYDLRKSLTALPLPKKNGVIQVRGLYKFVRHPMYVGVLVLSLGITVSSGSILKYGILAALYGLFSVKARYEERLLLAKYPGYKAYIAKTPRFVPRLRS